MSDLSITFWGVRGSIPVSNAESLGFGGNTICMEVTIGGKTLVVDAGSGIRPLGRALMGRPEREVHLLFTHLHLDHVIGLTAFEPTFHPDFTVNFYCGHLGGASAQESLRRLFREPFFPVPFEALSSRFRFTGFEAGDLIEAAGVKVRTIRLNHGIGATGYRFDEGGHAIAIITDHEHWGAQPDPRLVQFCAGVDILVYDGMWDEDRDYAPHRGWGHSTWQAGVALLAAARARRLAILHHAPDASDGELADRQERLKAIAPDSLFARKGLRLEAGG